ncbi:hypothetical protein GGS24DRAFT_493561 [Hypoxylon argillaceum]|nr:hypothetical protein GGS24DRAFT_493561 [Hypoxylon argillaceum]
MFEHFHRCHIPAIIVATTMMFGGMWPAFDPRGSMLEFGFPSRIANSPEAGPVMVIGQARGTVVGLLMFIFYYRRQFYLLDTFMAVTGAYTGIMDSYVVWKQGNPRFALFRLIISGFISALGFFGWTAGY